MANRGKIRITFVCVIVTAITVTSIILDSLMAGLKSWHSLLCPIGCLIVFWSIVFTFVEIRRLARISKNGGQAPEEEPDFYLPRRIIVTRLPESPIRIMRITLKSPDWIRPRLRPSLRPAFPEPLR